MADFRGSPETTPRTSRGRGRGQRVKVSPTHPGDVSPNRRAGASPSPPADQMTNLALDKMRKEASSSISARAGSNVIGIASDLGGRRGAIRGMKQQYYRRDPVTRTAEMGSKQGKAGTPLPLLANYFGLVKSCNWALYQHRVDFNPVEDLLGVRKYLVRANREQIGAYMFDGHMLYCIRDLGTVTLTTARKMGEVEVNVEVAIRCVGKVEPEEDIYFQFYNLVVRKCLFGMELEQMGRNFFDRHAAINIPAHRLTLWPGYVTAMRAHEKDIMLCVELTHKVLRLDSVLTLINGMKNQRDFKKAIDEELVGTIVMTSYNRKTYHVDDIDWTISPSHTFDCYGTPTTYAEYCQTRYEITLKDLTQPMLVVQPDRRDDHKGHVGPIYLVPELCQLTGLTDAMRANFSLMKDLSQHFHMVPAKRVQAVSNFMKRLQGSPELMKELELWGVQFQSQMTQCQGRLMPREGIVFAGPGKPEMVNDKADWTMAFRSRKMLATINLDRWVIFVPERNAGGVDKLVRIMRNVAKPLNFMIRPPLEIVPIRNPQASWYRVAIDAAIKKHPDVQMMFVILPKNKLEVYSSVKKRLSVDVGIPSQCFLAKNVASKGLKSIATKVVIQMNAKLGGEPWSIQLPLKNLMFAGFDVYHGAKGGIRGSVGALVSTTSPNFASYFNTVSIHHGVQELATNLSIDIQKSVQAYQRCNSGKLPERIVLFRDGVGDGDLKFVYTMEMEQVKASLGAFYAKEGKQMPKFTFIVVTKKINTRLFTTGPKPDNPPPGTVLDDVVTLPERYDFFLVAQAARQGTVSPCSYNVLYDTQNLDADKLQRITYKMCHMYFNWSETVAVPAPCQYAHKLAALTGISLGSKPAHPKLQNLLHFL